MKTKKITEQLNKNSTNIDLLDIKEILFLINEQDERIAFEVKKAIPEIDQFIKDLVKVFINNGRLFYLGAGTSGRLGILDASECPPTFSTNPNMVQGIIAGGDNAIKGSIEGAEDSVDDGISSIIRNRINKNDIVLGISASGTAPFVHAGLKEANKRGAITGLLMCNEPINKKYLNHVISIIVGPEVIGGSTRMKAGTATKLVLNMITTTSMIKLNKTYRNYMVDLKACNQKLWDRGTHIVSEITGLNYDESLKFLEKANGEVKTAIVMIIKECNKEEAKGTLVLKSGSLAKVIIK